MRKTRSLSSGIIPMSTAGDLIAQVQRRAIFKEIGRELSKLYAPLLVQKPPDEMETLLAKVQAKANERPKA